MQRDITRRDCERVRANNASNPVVAIRVDSPPKWTLAVDALSFHTRPTLETLALRAARRGNSLRQHWRTLEIGRGKTRPGSGLDAVQGYLSSSSRVAAEKTLIQERVNGSSVASRLVPTGFPPVTPLLASVRQIRSARPVTAEGSGGVTSSRGGRARDCEGGWEGDGDDEHRTRGVAWTARGRVCCRTERASAGRPLANPAGEKRARSVVVAHPLPRACSLRVCREPRTSTASFSSACHSPAAASAVRYRLSTSRLPPVRLPPTGRRSWREREREEDGTSGSRRLIKTQWDTIKERGMCCSKWRFGLFLLSLCYPLYAAFMW